MGERCIIEVGAHRMEDTDRLHQTWPHVPLWTFEPVPHLWTHLAERFKTYPNVHPQAYAIDVKNGNQTLHISGDTGCSSLHTFTEGVGELWDQAVKEYSPTPEKERSRIDDFSIRGTVIVRTIRLDSFLEIVNFPKDGIIEHLHCDAQGNDLNVLKSMGDYIQCLQSGVIETTKKEGLHLYTNGENYTEDAVAFLESNGFKHISIHNNDRANSENNIRFSRT